MQTNLYNQFKQENITSGTGFWRTQTANQTNQSIGLVAFSNARLVHRYSNIGTVLYSTVRDSAKFGRFCRGPGHRQIKHRKTGRLFMTQK